MPIKEAEAKAFDLIIDLAMELIIDYDLPQEADNKLDLIVALARHRHDVRSIQDKERMDEWKKRNEEATE